MKKSEENLKENLKKGLINLYNLQRNIETIIKEEYADFRPIEENDRGKLMTIESFNLEVGRGTFICSDGFGLYATKNEKSDIYFSFDALFDPPSWATHIIWYNK